MQGRTFEESQAELEDTSLSEAQKTLLAHHKTMPGDKPSSTILMDCVAPRALGALIAAYEHKTFIQSVIWDINAFDQWGVELGKDLSNKILLQIEDDAAIDAQQDTSTQQLISMFKQKHI